MHATVDDHADTFFNVTDILQKIILTKIRRSTLLQRNGSIFPDLEAAEVVLL